jgi:hypothetical protein
MDQFGERIYSAMGESRDRGLFHASALRGRRQSKRLRVMMTPMDGKEHLGCDVGGVL